MPWDLILVKEGRVRLLAVATRTRSKNHPEVPALGELKREMPL